MLVHVPETSHRDNRELPSQVPMAGIVEATAGRFTPSTPQRQGVVVHKDAWFLGYLVSGRCDWYAGEHIFELHAGSIQLVPPGVPHSGYDYIIQSSRAYWLVLKPQALWRGSGYGREVAKRLADIDLNIIHAGTGLEPWFQRVCGDLGSSSDYGLHQAECCAQFLLLEVIRCSEEAAPAVRASTDGLPESVSYAINRFSADLSSLPSVQEVSKELGLSRSHLHRLFVQHLGVSPKAYVQELRLRRARELLKQGAFVNTIPAQVSLATPGELRRLFKQTFGCQPEQWLQRQARLWKPS